MTKNIPALLLTTLIPFCAFSSEPVFNHIELTVGQSKMEQENHDTYSINGNLALTDKYYLSAEFEQLDHDEYRGADFYYLGGGYVYSLNNSSNIYAQLDYTHREQVSEYDESLSGFRMTLGYRNQFNKNLEGYAKLAYLSLEDDGNEYSDRETDSVVSIGVKYNLTRTFSSIGEVNNNGFKLGIRAEF
jgi:hypothetical protein